MLIHISASINGQEPTPSWRQRIRAVWMWAGDDAVIIGPAAAAWAGYFDELPSATPIGVLVPPNRRMSDQPLIRVVRARIDERDITSCDGILISWACRSAVDLAAPGCNELLHRMAKGNWLRPVPFERDRQRQTILTAAGWTVLRFTWRQIHDDPAAVVAQIKQTRHLLRTRLSLD